MSRTHAAARGALFLAAAGAVMSCSNNDAAVINAPVISPMFQSYVAIGNSITAGYQSGGINDSTQRQSYAVLLAKQMGTRFAYPSLVKPGCPPPINNTLAGTRVPLANGTASTGTTCLLRDPALATATLNNVAVPGITSADPTATVPVQAPGNPLLQLILGGKSMVQRALDAQPTFLTVWVGNNDILSQALGGILNGPTPPTPVATFIANYQKMVNQLTAGAPNAKGVLIGVVQVAGAPLLFQAGLIDASTAVRGAATQVAGRPVSLDPITCAGANAGALVAFPYLAAIRSRPPAAPGTIFCRPVLGGGTSDPGDNGILDITEQASVKTLIDGYNAYIKAKADSIGFGYYDPNGSLNTLRGNGSIPPFPNLAASAGTSPFGVISFDGVHPGAAAHIQIANDLIDAINKKFGTNLTKIPTS